MLHPPAKLAAFIGKGTHSAGSACGPSWQNQRLRNFLQVGDEVFHFCMPGLLIGSAQNGRWMGGGHHDGREWGFQELAAMLGDAKIATQQGLCRGGAEANNYFRMERGDFGVEPRPAGSNFRGIGFFVDAAFSAGLPFKMLHGIGDVDLFAINACCDESLIQEATSGPDKWFAFQIFLIAGLFAN